MFNFFENISTELFIILVINFFLIIILFLLNLSTRSKIKRLRYRYNKFMNGLSDRNIEQLLDNCIDELNQARAKDKEFEVKMNDIERKLLQCIQKIGVVRFNAFDNVGSDLSFSIAMLDDNDNGVVISGIYARDSSSTYAKPIVSGKSKYTLSAEEIQALDIAKKSSREKHYYEQLK